MRDGNCPICGDAFESIGDRDTKRWYFHTDLPDAKEWCVETAHGEQRGRKLTITYPDELEALKA